MYTCGNDNKKYAEEMKKFLEQKSATVTGVFSCKGYDTYGPFKLIGGLINIIQMKKTSRTLYNFSRIC